MNKQNSPLIQRSPWYQTLALLFAIVVLLACKLVEEVRIERDGSGVYRADLTLVGTEKQRLRAVKEGVAKNPKLKIVDEGPRGDDYFIVFEQSFADVDELSEKSSTYSWSVSEAGAFTRRARLEVTNRGGNKGSVSEHLLEVTMPGKVVDTNAKEISRRRVVWDRLAAGPRGELYVETEFLELPEGYSTKVGAAVLILVIGVILLIGMRLRRRRQG